MNVEGSESHDMEYPDHLNGSDVQVLRRQPWLSTARVAPGNEEKSADKEVDYEKLDRPTVIRKKASGDKYDAEVSGNMDYLDIPAFLRRQAD